MKKRLWSILTALALCLSLLPTAALAADPVTGVPYLDETGTSQTCASATEVTSDDTEWTSGWYVATGNITIGSEETPQRVTVSGTVHLILADGCELTVNGGIRVEGSNALTIYGQAGGTGTLVANGSGGAGIGSNDGDAKVPSCGKITINGGIVTANGSGGAGIGGGLGSVIGGGDGTIVINGGAVTANSGGCSAAIGGGGGGTKGGNGGKITISGGIVIATSSGNGAAIGGGGSGGYSGGDGGEITISGGTITATSTSTSIDSGAGIGGGLGNYGGGTFSTGTNGNAVIFASSIGDNSEEKKAVWSGIIFEGDSGQVYGNPTLTADLTIPGGATLTIPEGATLTNNGSIYVDGTLSGTVGGTGGVYSLLTLKYCEATETLDTSTYNSKTYATAGSDITLTPVTPPSGLQFNQWNVSLDDITIENNSFKMPSAALTVTAQFTSVPGSFVEVSTEDQLRLALDSGATSIKLMADIALSTTLTLTNKEITLDLNGHVFKRSNGTYYTETIKLEDGSSKANTSLTLIDSNPDQPNTVGGKTYKGGVIYGSITVTASGHGSNDCRLYANGGSVTGNVGLSSYSSQIYCTSYTPTAFYGNAAQWGSIYGGIFYGNNNDLKTIKGKTVTFKYNGSTYAREVVESGKTAVAPIPPQETTADGYHINWYQGDAEVSYDFSTPVTGDITLTAKWENTYRITFDTAGGTAVTPIMQAVGAEVTAPAAPEKTGYTFNGWNPATVPMKDITVTAQWTANEYDISYEGMEGAEYAGTLPTTHTYDTATEISAPTRTGYTFAGWQVNDGETLVKELTLGATDYTDTITLTAVWTPNVYNVTLDTNGGTIREGNVTEYTYGVGATLPTKVTRSGYYFIGWYDNEAFRGKPVSEITTTDIGDKTFYAGWIAISATPTYPPTTEETEGGTVTVLPKSPAQGVTVTITPTPDEGYAVAQVIVTDKNGDPVEVTDNGDGTYSFKQPSGKVTISVTFAEIEQPGGNPFVDVPADAYYYDAVLWAVENGVTEGTNADGTLFSPNDPCTRAQVVTFLWRAAGSPEPESLRSLSDVPADAYYAKAVAWALENGITTGTGDGLFSPDAVCSRAQIVTFLWRAQQSPAAGSANPFLDVAADAYYTDAVLWAVENGVTMGTNAEGTAFSPDDDCTRAQIVTFLYRCLGGE